ncbi:MAG: DUF4349 domain-containing protein [Gemmataceae bacterium]|nr:DUF4349 domain-containing protein [Gemmataceae bacterium]
MQLLWKKVVAVGFLVLLVLWAAGIVRGLILPEPRTMPALDPLGREETPSRLMSANNLKQLGLALTPLPQVLDGPDVDQIRVHDKGALLAATTATFDEDSALVRSALTAYQARVFNESNTGITPDRQLRLEIGVHPDKFDALVEQLRQIARLESVSVQLRDRTTEFRRLHAQRQSLKKHLESVLKLRGGKTTSIDEQLKVEQKIQEVEKELQALGVQLGDLLGKESFYHVHLTLFEYQPGSRLDRTYTVPRRLGDAFLWALGWWVVVAGTGAALVAAYLSIRVLRARA